jgi:hypothetical protein
MAAFWQWKVAEEIQFPPDCISFDEDDLPGVSICICWGVFDFPEDPNLHLAAE